MTLTTAQAFTAYSASLAATDYQKTITIPARVKTVNTRLAERFPATSDLPFVNGFHMGSAAKNTIVRPIDDVDVLAVFDNVNKAWDKYRNDSKSFIYRIRNAYRGLSIQQVGTRGQAVRVFFQNGGHVDVAPVFRKSGDVYLLPAGDGGWITTAPTKANDWFANRHRELGYNLAPLVRLLKAWNRSHSRRLRSFHLETMAGTMFSTLGANHRDAIHKFFQWAPNRVDVQDPGGQGGWLSSYLMWPARDELKTSFNSAAERVARAIDAESRGQHDEAKRLWAIVLGEDFPQN